MVPAADARLGDITGSRLLHFMSGNLSFQIEHHLFPDLPSNHYQEIAPKIQDLFEPRADLRQWPDGQAGRLGVEEGVLSLPNGFRRRTRRIPQEASALAA